MKPPRGIFITATDTGAGKTLVAALVAKLAAARDLGVTMMKPVASGCAAEDGELVSEDLTFYRRVGLPVEDEALACPLRFKAPLSPNVAAALEGKEIDTARVMQAFTALAKRNEFVVVEGIGGILVPLSRRHTVADLMETMRLPVLVVAANRLGVINHAALTVEAAKRRGMALKGIVLNSVSEERDLSRRYNRKAIEALTGVPVLCELSFHDGVQEGDLDDAYREFEATVGIDELFND